MEMNQYDYAKEKLYVALRSLALGTGDVRSRLKIAFETFHTLKPKDLPPEHQENWKSIQQQLMKYGPEYDYKGDVYRGSVENTMRRIKNRTGQKIASMIFHIAWDLWTNEKYTYPQREISKRNL